jgi:hypothetical protein
LGKLRRYVDINRAQETIKENIKISAKDSLSYYELKKPNPSLEKNAQNLPDQRKQAKLYILKTKLISLQRTVETVQRNKLI